MPANEPGAAGSAASPAGWANIEAVRAEWPRSQLNEQADLRSWAEGVRLYDNDDYESMMRCATLLSAALAHSLYGEGILRGPDLPETVHKVLFCSLFRPPDGTTFRDSAQHAARLALMIIRENGWQPESMGGRGLFDHLIMASGSYLLLGMVIGPAGRPWEGDLRSFFAVPPQPAVAHIPDSRSATVDRMYDMVERIEDGDEASRLRARGVGLWMNGDRVGGLELLEQAARLGDAQAMSDAGALCMEMGKSGEARFWYETAARAGDARAMFNMGVIAKNSGDRQMAAGWFQQAAEAGEADGYAALTQLADNTGDRQAERRWARLGAEAGQAFCMFRHGLYLAMDAEGDTPMLRRAAAFLEAAAERGDVDAMLMAGNVNGQLGQEQRARAWYDRARATGDAKALEMLDRHGL